MDTSSLRILPTVNMTVFLLVCAAFFLHYLSVGRLPDGMESWVENNQWPMWMAAALTVASAPAVPPLSLTPRRPGEDG
jgi:hypothetical protein